MRSLTVPHSLIKNRLRINSAWAVYFAYFFVAALILVALFGTAITPFDPNEVDLTARLESPSLTHWLGTDHLGRDMLSRLLVGVRVSLGAVAVTLAIILTMGIIIGGTSAYIGGRVDQVIMRLTDIFLTFPTLVL